MFPELRESEDERIRSEIIDYLGLVGKGDGDYAQPMIDRWIAWLEQQECGEKGLKGPQEIGDWRGDEGVCKKQKEQKPTEWSEEDEERIQSILFSIGYCKDEYPNKKDYSKDIAWLKSLRPSWKPSEEQLNAMNFAITYFMHETNYKNPTELRELYDDLLKLQ